MFSAKLRDDLVNGGGETTMALTSFLQTNIQVEE